jgi:hypothetical protein
MLYRSIVGSLFACLLILALNGCSSTQPPVSKTQASIQGTIVDSTTGAPLDSAHVFMRRRGDTVATGAGGTFSLDGMPPGLYVFDVSAYGYHPHRHVSALVRPGDETVSVNIPLLPQTLQVRCEGLERTYHQDVQSFVRRDSSAVGLRLIDLFAKDGEVRLQPVVTSKVSAPLFLPDSLGPRSHYEVELVDESGSPLDYHYKKQQVSRPELHQIYKKGDILVAVPEQAKRIAPEVLTLEESVSPGTAIYARVHYDFSLDDTLRSTPQTDFPRENLDSLQVANYDTMRVDGSLIAPDSLVERRDTTVVRTVGLDTTVTRDGYLLYSTERDTNAFRNAEEAVRELYVPDSVKARARLDSLIAAGVDTSRSPADEDAARLARPTGPLTEYVVRTDRRRLDSLIADNSLARILSYGIPNPSASIDSLKLLTDSSLAATLQPPRLDRRPIKRYTPRPDSVLQSYPADSLGSVLNRLVRDSVVVDSLIRVPTADTGTTGGADLRASDSLRTAGADSLQADSLAPDSTALRATADDSVRTDSAGAVPDSLTRGLAADSVTTDSLLADTTGARKPTVSDTLTIGELFPASLPADSIRAYLERAGVATDSVVIDSTIGSYVNAPPPETYRYVPGSETRSGRSVLVLDPAFSRLRVQAKLDTARVEDLLALTPERVGEPPEPRIERVLQQIILVPTGGYRQKYLDRWTAEQQSNLRDHYCEIFRLPLQSPWRSTTMR